MPPVGVRYFTEWNDLIWFDLIWFDIPTYYNSASEDYTVTDDDKIFIPRIDTKIIPQKIPFDDFLLPLFQWVNDSSKVIQKLTLDKNDWISFAAYNANLQTKRIFVSRLVSQVMPLLFQKASDPLTVSYVLNFVSVAKLIRVLIWLLYHRALTRKLTQECSSMHLVQHYLGIRKYSS